MKNLRIAVLGLGEAGSHFANDFAAMGLTVAGWDPAPRYPLNAGVRFAHSNADAAKDADIILSANLSAESEYIAAGVASVLTAEKIYCEMNTSSPDKKHTVFEIIKSSGVQFVDLAIMAPVPPKGIKTPFLASGPGAQKLLEQLKPYNLNLDYLSDVVGDASTRKLLRSIVYKGVAAVICEAVEAGKAFGLDAYIREQISSVIGGNETLIDRFVEGSFIHAERRIHEMEAVVEMLSYKQIEPLLSIATKKNLQKLAEQKRERIMQTAIPVMQFRGGSSKGLFFKASDLPADETERNKVVIAAMEGAGSGDPRQIDGLGGASSLTSKVGIISLSHTPGADLDYLFLQVGIGSGKVSTTQTCGNMLAGVLPFAIESGMIKAQTPTTSAKINIVNTGGFCEVVVETPNGQVEYEGNARVDGVPGTAAPIICNYLETMGSTCGALLPTGNALDIIRGIEVTCIDNGMPIVIMRASDFRLTGHESKETLEANEALRQKIEQIRLEAGVKMNLSDVSQQTIPKMCLVSSGEQGIVINTRMFIPHVVHEAIGVLAAVSVATACVISGTVAKGIAQFEKATKLFSIGHPSGELTVSLDYKISGKDISIVKSGVIRTARLLSRGEVYIPGVL